MFTYADGALTNGALTDGALTDGMRTDQHPLYICGIVAYKRLVWVIGQ